MDSRIYLEGHLDSSWQELLAGLTIHAQGFGITLLIGSLLDQAALHGGSGHIPPFESQPSLSGNRRRSPQREERAREMGPHTSPKPTERTSTDEYNHKQC